MMTSALMGSGSQPVSVELQGSDIDKLIVFANKLKKRMEGIPGLVDVDLNQKDERPELWVKIDRSKVSMLGISTAIIMFSVPFAFRGVFYAFYFFHVTLGLISFMGIIMLIGIVVNNAVVLLDYTHILQNAGKKFFRL